MWRGPDGDDDEKNKRRGLDNATRGPDDKVSDKKGA